MNRILEQLREAVHALNVSDGAKRPVFDMLNAAGKEFDRLLTESRESETRFRHLSEASLEGIFIHEKGTILDVNRAMCEMNGYTLAEVIGTNLLSYVAPESHQTVIQSASGHFDKPVEVIALKKDGSRFSVDVQGKDSPYHGRKVRVVCVRDISERKRTEEALKESEGRYRELFENASAFAYTIDIEGRFSSVNRALADALEYSVEEMVGMPYMKILPPESIEKVRRMVTAKLKGEVDITRYEVDLASKSGRIIPVEIHSRMIRKQGMPAGIQGMGLDITERRRNEQALKESEERYRELFENASDFVYTNDLGGLFTSVNKALCKRSGYREDELVGAPISKIVPPASLEKARKMTEAKVKGETAGTRYTVDIIGKNGEIIPIELNSRLIVKDGKPVGVQGIGRDITDRLEAEARLKEAKTRAEEATRLKDKFVSLVAHDLKSPLAAIMGNLRHILDKKGTAIPDASRENLEAVLKGSDALIHMIDELLNINLLQSGRILPQPIFIDARTMVGAVHEMLEHLAVAKNIALVNDIPPGMKLLADYNLFTQVLQNLVSNAVKFTHPGGTVTVFAPADRPSTIAVKDTGVGMGRDIRENIFRQEVKTSTRGTAGERGSGFGLPMCHEIMKAHNGGLAVESELGKGSVFYATLPPAIPRILLADDDDITLEVLGIGLKNHNPEYHIFKARNGQEALDIVEKMPPHIIIADIMMPELDGFGLLERIRSNHATRNTPFILITSSKDIAMREMAWQKGANDFISKPLAEEDFLPRVRRYL